MLLIVFPQAIAHQSYGETCLSLGLDMTRTVVALPSIRACQYLKLFIRWNGVEL